MRSALILAAAILAAAACSRDEPAEDAPTSELSEASMSFDLEDLEPFLREMAADWDGFGPSDVDTILEGVRSLSVEEQDEWRFSVRRDGRDVPLVVRVFLDDVDSPDLYLFSSDDVADELRSELDAFWEREGR